MSVLSRVLDLVTFRDLPANRPIQTRAAGLTYPTYTVGKPQWLPTDPATLAIEGYDKVTVCFACVNVIANAIAGAPMRAVQNLGTGDQEPIDPTETSSPGRLAMLVNQPNPYNSQPEWVEQVVKIAAVTGVCVYEKVRGPLDQVVALYPLRTDWLKPIPRNNQAYDWEYSVPGVRPPFLMKAEDVGVFRYNSAVGMGPMGTPPLYAAMRAVAIENTMADFVKLFFQNNGVPSWVAVLKDEYQSLEQDAAEAAAERLMQRFGGGRGAGKIAIMPGLEKLERVSLDFDEMAFTDLSDMTTASICSAFAVPPILIHTKLGLDASTYSNYGQARRAFYEDTIAPLWRRLDGAMTRALLPEFDVDDSVSLEFDTSDVPALQDDLTNERAQKIELWKAQVITRNEIRSDFGYAERDDESGAELYAPASPFGMLPVGGDGEDERRDRTPEMVAMYRDVIARATYPEIPAHLNGNGHHPPAMRRLPPETRAAVATTARDAYDALAAQGAPALRRFWKAQGARISSAATRYTPAEWAHRRIALSDRELRDIGIDWNDEDALLLAELLIIHQRALGRGWRAALAMGLPGTAFNPDDPAVVAALAALAGNVALINATTRNRVQDTVSTATTEGKTMAELESEITLLFGETFFSRAVLVAHHESMLAYTGGVVAAAKQSGTVTYAEIFDNPDHAEPYEGMSDGLTCAERHGMIVPVDRVSYHANGEHPNGSFSVGLVFDVEE